MTLSLFLSRILFAAARKNAARAVLCAMILAAMPWAPARAETPMEFSRRIEDAYRDENKKAALWDLFYTGSGLDPVAYGLLVETVEKLDLLSPPVKVLVEPLLPDEEVVEKLDGYVYFQNLEPAGAVNIVNPKEPKRIIRQYYGRHEGMLYLTATIKQKDTMRPATIKPNNWFYRRNRGQTTAPPRLQD